MTSETGVKCPLCGKIDCLVMAQAEHTDYSFSSMNKEGIYSFDPTSGDCYDNSFIHIHCNECDTYWYSEGEFQNDVKVANKKEGED